MERASVDVSFIFVNYNTADFVIASVNSIFNINLKIKFEIVVVDNCSSDFAELEILKRYKNVNLIQNKVNEGFGHACNEGAKNSGGNFIVLINPDTIVYTDIFTPLLEFYEKTENSGFLGVLLVDSHNKPIYSFNHFPGYYWEILQAVGAGSNNEIKKLLNIKEIAVNPQPFEVDWLIGAFLFVSRKVFNQLKGFDDRFFLYYEDVDIQYRAKLLGFKNYCIPFLNLHHHEKGSVKSSRGDDIYHFYMYKSKMMYYYLHFPFVKRNVLRVFLLIGLLCRIIILIPRNSFTNKKKKFKQYLYMLRYFAVTKKTVFENKRI